MKEVFIISAKRTAIGSFLGSLSNYSATELSAITIKAAWQSVSVAPEAIEADYIGNVLSANLGQSPARQACLLGGLSVEADCTTVNKVCASGLKATIIGAQQIQLGLNNLIVVGGMESMSNVPHYVLQRKLNKLGDEKLVDGLLKDGLTDAYNHLHMGNAAEHCSREFSISRNEQDEYASQSYAKALRATQAGKFKNEIIPVPVKGKKSKLLFAEDEDIPKLIPEKIALLEPVFEKNGTVTAANASNLNDGSATLLLASEDTVKKYSLNPLARIMIYADAAQSPEKFTTSPSVAITKALKYADLSLNQIDFFEINEAYAAMMIANQRLLNLDMNTVNVYGGAIAIGHPLGASGARILCTLLSVLKQEGGKYGLAAICNGGGGASAMIVERLTNN